MGEDLLALTITELKAGSSPDSIREKLIDKGFLEDDIDQALSTISSKRDDKETKKTVKLFTTKEVFDRVGYGFVPTQFINILFWMTGASFFWIGLINGIKAMISMFLSSVFQEYTKERTLGKKLISVSGYLYGFSFLGMSVAILAKSVPMFAFFLLLGSVGVVTHGDLYAKLVRSHLKKERMTKFLAKIAQYGILITASCMLVSGWLMDKFPVLGKQTVALMGTQYPMFGYLITFEITALAFILSGHFLAHIKENKSEGRDSTGFLGFYLRNLRTSLGAFMRNKHLFLLILTSVILGFTQVIGSSYFGIYMFQEFKSFGFGGFTNIAMIYFIAILVSFLGAPFSRLFHKNTGLAPTLVFGTLLVAMLPLALAYNPNLPAVTMANALSVIGATILGVSQGLLARRLLRDDERKVYFSVVSMAAFIPFIFLVPLGSYYAQTAGLEMLFKILGFLLVFLVAPLYIILVLMGSKSRL